MKITFNIDFHTRMGQQVFVVGSLPELGGWNETKALGLDYIGNGRCQKTIDLKKYKEIAYRYFVKDTLSGELVYERGAERIIKNKGNISTLFIKDFWKTLEEDTAVYNSSLFTKVLHQRKEEQLHLAPEHKTEDTITLQIYAPKVQADEVLYLSGNQNILGYWDEKKALKLSANNFPVWSCTLPLEEIEFPFLYKYILKKKSTDEILAWEEGDNRIFYGGFEKHKGYIHTDENLRIPRGKWRGAGVSIPVFSLRTKNSYGVGEFLDLKEMVNWVNKLGMNIIQILPINDTTITHTWEDSYPYKPISVFALHPMYLNIPRLKRMTATEKKEYTKEKEELNKLSELDYEAVNKQKLAYARRFFVKQKKQFLSSLDFKKFFNRNKEWLQAYAVFCFLRDKYKTADFSQWEHHSIYSKQLIKELSNEKSKAFHEVAFYYYLQFHLDAQLQEAVSYARTNNVALKGDIPIGIAEESVDAWKQPQLFNLGTSAGAPPDAFAVQGQNWGFPTYNWEEMEKDNFLWWKQRFQKMADYFDAYRIDHILGFFRIWEIPQDAIWGLLGHFNKALPYSSEELAKNAVFLDYNRYCKPYIREYMLHELFKEKALDVKETFLNTTAYHCYELKEEYNTQKKIANHFAVKAKLSKQEASIQEGLMSLLTEVLFIPDPINPSLFHPRISLHNTFSYRDLDEGTQQRINKVYIDFFYHRHDSFWCQQAIAKLPVIIASTDMLVCGEDLGMVPACVPDVMWQQKILSLEIQRMPKNDKIKFGQPTHAPYLSVCTTSTHDMSSLRAWWEEDRAASQQFYNTILSKWGDAPYFAEPWLCEEIIAQHLASPAMLTIFPLQDVLAIDENLRIENPNDERINIPSNPKHYWRYRMHLSLSELENASTFNTKLKELIMTRGR